MFYITGGKGFQMQFANGWTVSVQFGIGNYCQNRSYDFSNMREADIRAGAQGSPDAEVAAWDANGTWYDFGSDTVAGWKTPDEVAAFIANVASFPAARPTEDTPKMLGES